MSVDSYVGAGGSWRARGLRFGLEGLHGCGGVFFRAANLEVVQVECCLETCQVSLRNSGCFLKAGGVFEWVMSELLLDPRVGLGHLC